MIALTDVTVRVGGRILFEDVNWHLKPGAHYGLVGANGTGKSTLLRVMSGELGTELGTVRRPANLRLGMLRQDQFSHESATPLDVVLMGRPALWDALAEKAALMARAGESMDDADGHRLGELEVTIADEDGYTAEAHGASLLEGLGIPEARQRRPLAELSGGYRLRVLLAQTLFQQPDLLLLDEPTNHLDLPSIRWLEGHLSSFPGTLVLVSHDRHFLNGVCDHMADMDYETLTVYPGNYDAFEAAKALAQEQKLAEIANVEKKQAEMQAFVDRFRAKATKARQAQSRVKQLERIEIPEIRRSSRQYPNFAFSQVRPSGQEALAVKGLGKSYGSQRVLHDVSFEVKRGEKVAVVGANGVGKSTLLMIIAGAIKPDAGDLHFGYEVSLGYFAQDHHQALRGRVSVYDWLRHELPAADVGTLRGTLGKVLFSGDDQGKPVQALSGGEAARLLLAGLMVRRGNLMILDEPTNHLDLESREALMEALVAFPGTLLFVSHDRHVVSTVADRVLALSPEGLTDFPGGYDAYLAAQGEDYLSAEGMTRQPRPEAASGTTNAEAPPTQDDYAARKARKRADAKLRRRVEQLEQRIETLEGELADIDACFSKPDYFDKTAWSEVRDTEQRQRDLRARLQEVMAEWEQAANQAEGG